MREYALKCVWEKTTPLSGKNNTYPVLFNPLAKLFRNFLKTETGAVVEKLL